MKKIIISIMALVIIGLSFYVGHLKNQVASKDTHIDEVNLETRQIVNTLFELDSRGKINLSCGELALLQQIIEIHPFR